jgi:hypothetical protein
MSQGYVTICATCMCDVRCMLQGCLQSMSYVHVCTPDSILQLSFAVADNKNRCLEVDSTLGPVNVYVDLVH